MAISWVRVDLDGLGRWLSGLLEMCDGRDGAAKLRAELTANLMAAASRDGSGDTFVAGAVKRTAEFVEARAARLSAAGSKGAATRWGGGYGR